MKLKISSIIISLFVFYCLLFVVSDSQAEYKYTFQTKYPAIQGESPTSELISYVRYIYLFGLGLVSIAALGALVYGGFQYMLSGTITSKEEAKKWIWGALSGLALALAAYLILKTINPDLVYWKIELPKTFQSGSPDQPSGATK